MDMNVRDFLKVVAPLEGDMRPAGGIGALGDAAAEAARPSGIPMPEAPADAIPADKIIGSVRITGEDILRYGTAQEALVAGKLEMTPHEWGSIKFVDVATLIKETPENGSKLTAEELAKWYQTYPFPRTLPEEFKFDSFKRHVLLADAIRDILRDNVERDYLEKLPVGELVQILVLQRNK